MTTFVTPQFTKPKMPEISTKAGNIDITQNMDNDTIKQLVAVISLKHLKHFYDGLVTSMENYSSEVDTNIVIPLSSTMMEIGRKTDEIGTKTNEIEAQIKILQDSTPEIAN
jgi:hypothetical protein